jgi:hypothetical protein
MIIIGPNLINIPVYSKCAYYHPKSMVLGCLDSISFLPTISTGKVNIDFVLDR